MLEIVRTNSSNIDFIELVAELDKDLAIRDGEEHSFYHQFNSIDEIKNVIVLYQDKIPVACGAIKHYENSVFEVKRMFVPLKFRNKGFATIILSELVKWAKELEYKALILETGLKQPEAIALYIKNGFLKIPNYGQYEGVENSVCFKRKI